MYSLRRRLVLLLALGFAVLIGGGSFYVAGVVSDRLTEEFDAALLAKARAIVALTEQEAGQIEFDYTPEHMSEFERDEEPEYFQFWLDDGTLLLKSRGIARDRDLPLLEDPPSEPRIRDVRLPDGRPGRSVEIAYVPRTSGEADEPEAAEDPEEIGEASETRGLRLVVARGRGRLDGVLAGMRRTILLVGGLGVLLGGILVWRVLAAGLRPLDRIAAQVGELDAENLEARVALARPPRELAPVVGQLNALLDRLSASFDRERRFAGNVAHELRTPIAELRTLAAVGVRWPDDELSVVRYFSDVDEIASRMEVLVSDLLLLARCHAGVEDVSRAPTSLKQVITSTWSRLAASASGAGLSFRMEVPDDMVVESDAGKLEIVFANVLGNAVSYSRPNSEIRCVGTRRGPRFRLEFTNAARRLSREDLANLAEPFWRKDEARSPSEHAGLGLSLASALADLLELEVRFDQDRDGTFRVRLEGRNGGGGEPARAGRRSA